MAAGPCDRSVIFVNTLVSPRLGEHAGEVSPQSVKPFWRRFLKVSSSKNIIAAKPFDPIGEHFVPHGEVIIPVKFSLDLFSHFREEDF